MPKPWTENTSREAAIKYKPESNTVCISISSSNVMVPLKSGYDGVLRLTFDDIDPARHTSAMLAGYIPMTPAQAKMLAARLIAWRGKNILVHCEAGVSRSAAVVEVILEAFPEYDDCGGHRFPNGHVKSLLKRAMGLTPMGVEVV